MQTQARSAPAPAALLTTLALSLGACVSTEAPPNSAWRDATVETATFDAMGRPTNTARDAGLGSLVWGLASRDATWGQQDPEGDAAPQDPDAARRDEEARLRSQFGSSVIILDDGRVTQQYPFVGEGADVLLKLIAKDGQPVDPEAAFNSLKIGGNDASSILGRMLGKAEVEISYIPKFSTITGVAIRDKDPVKNPAVTGIAPAPAAGLVTHLVLVTGQPSEVLQFERSLDLFYANMPQVEIGVQVIEFSSADALSFGVSAAGGNPSLTNLNSGQLVREFTGNFPLNPPLVGSNPVTDIGTFTLGGIHDAWELAVQIEALEAKNLANVVSSPKLVVRNGGMATISTFTDFPFPKANISTTSGNTTADIQFKPVGVSMNILPTIAGTQTVILQISASVSAVTGFAQTNPVDTPIISDRSTTTTVHVNHNESVVIGGLISESDFESETKVPILGDIPLLGFLFRSTSRSTSKSEIQFIITPKIVRGSAAIRAL